MDHDHRPEAAQDAPARESRERPSGPEPHPLSFGQIRIENTNHCGYKCFMCPRDKLTRALGFMALADLGVILDRVGTHAGPVHLHGFGEPLLDKALIDKVSLVRERWPEAQVVFFSTLGVKVDDDYFHRLAEAGVGNVQVSFYGVSPETYRKVAGVGTFELAKRNLERLAEARAATGAEFKISLRAWGDTVWEKWSDEVKRQRTEFLRWVDSLGVLREAYAVVHNYGGGRDYNTPPREGLCSVVWGLRRRILQVTWDLKVIPCCFDFDATVVFGDLRTQSLAEIFPSRAYRRFIQAHLDNDLTAYPVCEGCERCFQP